MRYKSTGHEQYTFPSSQTTWLLIWILRSTDGFPTENIIENDMNFVYKVQDLEPF